MNSLRNVLKTLSVCLLLTLTVLGLGMLANAQAPVAAPSITFSLPDGTEVNRANYPILLVRASIAYASGIRSASISSPIAGGSANLNGSTSGYVTSYFFAGYYPAGYYTFTAHALGVDGSTAVKAITVHSN